jgi:glycosyltransferase involved in cell wall biosynthesis
MISCLEIDSPQTASDCKTETCVITPHSDRVALLGHPLRTLFMLTSMPVGGAETLLVNMIRRFRPDRISPSIACTKELGPLGELLSSEVPVSSHWLKGKFDVSIVPRFASFLRRQQIDALVTVGAGDKMFWGRIAAAMARLPVVCSALHSTGWPDGVGRLNRWLTPWTDRYIGVAKNHGTFLVDWERFPESKVAVIPNGVDIDRFLPDSEARLSVRDELGIPSSSKLVGIVAALRPEKNHHLFLDVARRLSDRFPNAYFLVVGDGPARPALEQKILDLNLTGRVILLGTRTDTPRLVAALDVFALTSHNEASPVSILEALACGVPVVSTRVGSISESVMDDWNGYTVDPGDEAALSQRVASLLSSADLARTLGSNGRDHVLSRYSLDTMVRGYEELIASVYWSKLGNSLARVPR